MTAQPYVHFTLETPAPGVFAAVATPDGAAYSNAGIIDLGDRTVVFDTFDMPEAAQELRTAAERLTGSSPAIVINSHVHGDHWSGNCVFARDALIVSTQRMRDDCPRVIAEQVTEPQKDPSALLAEISRLEAQLQATEDLRQRAMLERMTARMRRIVDILPGFSLHPPALGFEGTLALHGTERSVQLIASGGSHTPGDCYLALPAERIVFLGDIAFFAAPPFMPPDCNLDAWLTLLDQFAASGIRTFVPGHGPVGSVAELQRQKQYMVDLRDMVAQAVDSGAMLDDVLHLPLPAEFSEWDVYGRRHQNNLRSLHAIVSKGDQ